MKYRTSLIIAIFLLGLDLLLSTTRILSLPSTAQISQSRSRKIEANRLLDQSVSQAKKDRYRDAIRSLEKARKIYREIGDRNGLANVLTNLGLAYWFLSEYALAIEAYQQAYQIFKAEKDYLGQGDVLSNLGGAYWSLAQYRQAIDTYQQALSIF